MIANTAEVLHQSIESSSVGRRLRSAAFFISPSFLRTAVASSNSWRERGQPQAGRATVTMFDRWEK